ncbi:MAG: Alanine--tRNA ligase [Mycobacterium sp.]|nr:Alanine--tRNA ligase [Mycobacterium sp.]
MESAEIRRRFTRHFEDRGHTAVPSASLLAADPTLLFVNAGMVPFKPYLLGELPPPYPRATSIQKCVRTGDIENVGVTTRHGTFFEMCGNFSFGDYFKERAIPLAWELLTTSQADGGFGFDPQRLWVTVYLDDDEAADIWTRQVGVPAERVQRRGKADNFWSMGVPGPCGPCSEIYYDRGPEHGRDGGPEADEDRYLEVWNLVFMQSVRGPGLGKEDYPILGDLPAKNIDTGMGLDRMAILLQGVENIYEIDLLRPVLDRAAQLTGQRYGADPQADVRLRVIADHVRTATMLIGDGATPSNEGRGYVLRRLLRRAIRNLRLLGLQEPALPELVEVVAERMGAGYPELIADRARIIGYAAAEEEAFTATLRHGATVLDVAVQEARSAGGTLLAADKAFQLHDTFGFPIDLTLEMAAEQGVSVDEEGFRRLMLEQRTRAKQDNQAKKTGHADLSVYRGLLDESGPSIFTGYEELRRSSTVRGLLARGERALAAVEGDEVDVVLDVTPFYAEGGGQLADTGLIVFDGGQLEVLDVQRPLPDLIVHRVKVRQGELVAGSEVEALVDADRRRAVSRAHTATHLIHQAIRDALGDAATQAGSLNAPGRLRFDFANPSAVPQSVLADVEDRVNAVLLDDLEVRAFVTSQDEARAIGAMALFGEKYGERVRVVEVGDYARELCGGTHVARSAQVGAVSLLGESSIGSGVRRVEALVGLDAFRFLARERVLVTQLSDLMQARPQELPERIAGVLDRLKTAEKELARLRVTALLADAGRLAEQATDLAGLAYVGVALPAGTAAGDVRTLAMDVRGRFADDRPGVVVAAAENEGKVSVVVAVTPAAQAQGIKAGALVGELAPLVGGRGGGKPDLAQGGGTDPSGIPILVARAEQVLSARGA